MALLAIILVIAGCATRPVNSVTLTRPVYSSVYNETRDTSSAALARKIHLESITTSGMVKNFLTAQAVLANTTRRTRTIEYRFEWFDDDAMIANPAAYRWTIVRIPAGDRLSVTSVAPAAHVRNVRFKYKMM